MKWVVLLLLLITLNHFTSEQFISHAFFETPVESIRVGSSSKPGEHLLRQLESNFKSGIVKYRLQHGNTDDELMYKIGTGELDLAVVNQLSFDVKQKRADWGILGNLKSSPINLIATDDTGIVDLSQLTNFVVNTGNKHSIHTRVAKILLKDIPHRLNHETTFDEYGKSYHVVLRIAQHPDFDISKVFSLVNSHYLTMNQINRGGVHINQIEKPFFEEHPVFAKKTIDLVRLQTFYPNLTIYDRLLLNVPTISTTNLLIAREKMPYATKILASLFGHRVGRTNQLKLVSFKSDLRPFIHSSVHSLRTKLGLNIFKNRKSNKGI